MRKLLALLLCAALALGLCPALGEEDLQEGAFRYSLLPDGGAMITGYDRVEEAHALEIPASLGGHPVTAIGPEAFAYVNGQAAWVTLTEVTVPEGVTAIGEGAFMNQANLVRVSLPGSLETIGSRAFFNCRLLEAVRLPEGLRTIGAMAFANCRSLTEITVPEGVTELGSEAFASCEHLVSAVLPDSLGRMGVSTFYLCNSLESVRLPSGLEDLPANTFFFCGRLTRVNIPEGLVRIGPMAFCDCISLEAIPLPDTLTEIGESAFYHCAALREITIPGGVTVLRADVLGNCFSLETASIPEGLVSIGDRAFGGDRSLTAVRLIPGTGDASAWTPLTQDGARILAIAGDPGEAELRLMMKILARHWAVTRGCRTVDDVAADGTPRDMDAWRAETLTRLEAEVRSLEESLAELEAQMAEETRERAVAAMTRRAETLRADIRRREERIRLIREGGLLGDGEAIALWLAEAESPQTPMDVLAAFLAFLRGLPEGREYLFAEEGLALSAADLQTVLVIEARTLEGAEGLIYLRETIPDGVAPDAFRGCDALTEVTLPAGMTLPAER